MSDDDQALAETSKAVQEIAKTAGKAIDVSRRFGRFISRYVAGTLEQGIGIFEDKLRYLRWERQIRLIKRAEELMDQLGEDVPTKVIPLKLAIPLFQAASLEDDDYLQDMWAKLLVNASVSKRAIELRRVHIDILERLSPIEALILERIYSIPVDSPSQNSVITRYLPDSALFQEDGGESDAVQPSEEIVMALANLARLGCLTLPTTWGGGEIFSTVYQTVIGRSLFEACRLDESTT